MIVFLYFLDAEVSVMRLHRLLDDAVASVC